MYKAIRNLIKSHLVNIVVLFIFMLGISFFSLNDSPLHASGKSIEKPQIPDQPYRTPGTLLISGDKQTQKSVHKPKSPIQVACLPWRR